MFQPTSSGGALNLIMLSSASKKMRERVLFYASYGPRGPRLGYQFHEIVEKKGILFSSFISSFNV